MKLIAPFFCLLSVALAQTPPNIRDAISCPQTSDGRQPYQVNTRTSGDLRRIVINSPDAVCNDGTPAIIYVRAARAGATEPDGPSANRWVIHFLGGSSCDDYQECADRWCGVGQWQGTLMTTAFEGEFRNQSGLFNRNGVNRLADRNLVLMKYCSSDNWQGRRSNAILRDETDPARSYSLHFQGATIVSAIFDALERGVTGMPKLGDATDVLISGDSAGAVGARAHLDRLAARLRAANPTVRVRGNFEATFDPDYNGKQGFPAGDPRDPVYARKTESYNRVHVQQRNAQLDDSCLSAHRGAPYLCADNGYLTMNHITTPFFQMMDIQDQLLIDGFQEAGADFTDVEFAQGLTDQLTALTRIRDSALERTSISLSPGVGARNCRLHVTWADDDGFFGRKLRTAPGATAYSYYDLLWNFLTGGTPASVIGPRPPDAPNPPVTDAACLARASTSPTPTSVVTLSSGSYDLNGIVAPESIVASFGTNLTANTATASTVPWPTTLGGLQVTVTDVRGTARLAPLYYVSPTQLLFLIPTGTAPGVATIAIGTQRSAVTVAATAPAIFTAAQNGRGVAAGGYLKISAAGARTEGLLFHPATRAAVPISATLGDQIYLALYGTGMRGGRATATVGGVSVPVSGPVAHSQFQGLDQINLGPLPLRIGSGSKTIIIRQGDDIANLTTVTFGQP